MLEKIIKQKEISKEEINNVVDVITRQIQDGEISALDLTIQMKALEKVMAQVQKNTFTSLFNECEKYGNKFEHHGAKIQVCESGVKYDYSVSKDWSNLQNQIDQIKAQQKVLETSLKTNLPYENVDGELVIGIPRESTMCVKISI